MERRHFTVLIVLKVIQIFSVKYEFSAVLRMICFLVKLVCGTDSAHLCLEVYDVIIIFKICFQNRENIVFLVCVCLIYSPPSEYLEKTGEGIMW